jgi:hypothetical protein
MNVRGNLQLHLMLSRVNPTLTAVAGLVPLPRPKDPAVAGPFRILAPTDFL